jgi:hypothetical protein
MDKAPCERGSRQLAILGLIVINPTRSVKRTILGHKSNAPLPKNGMSSDRNAESRDGRALFFGMWAQD